MKGWVMKGSGATISKCKKYRYSLWRIWTKDKPLCMFIMLNPSTADVNEDDPTIRRCIGFAKSWDYGGILIGNVIAYRATNPNELKTLLDFRTKENEKHLKNMLHKVILTKGIIIAAWGNHGKNYLPRSMFYNSNLSVHHLGLTKSGQPKHPLYLKSSTKPELWECK